MNTHYVCTGGCKGVSTTPGVCQAELCLKQSLPLTECGCQDGMHEKLVTPCQDCGETCGATTSGVCPIASKPH